MNASELQSFLDKMDADTAAWAKRSAANKSAYEILYPVYLRRGAGDNSLKVSAAEYARVENLLGKPPSLHILVFMGLPVEVQP